MDALKHHLDRLYPVLSKVMGYNCIYAPFGRPTPEQAEVVARYVKGKVVHDLGAYKLALSAWLMHLGAERVVAIDESLPHVKVPKKVTFLQHGFLGYHGPIDVAFVSWPASWGTQGLVELVARSSIVIYLGSCIDGSYCGNSELYQHFLRRELLEYVPHRSNSLEVLGRHIRRKRPPTGEEVGALCGKILQFEKAEERAKKGHALSGVCQR